MNKTEFIEKGKSVLGGSIIDLKTWLYTHNDKINKAPIDLYTDEKFDELYEILYSKKYNPPLIIISDLDPYGEENWNE